MQNETKIIALTGFALLFSACAPTQSGPLITAPLSPAPPHTIAVGEPNGGIFAYNQRLGKGVNFGNVLEAPTEGEWGFKLEEKWFDEVKKAGFDHIRLPVSWTNHAAKTAPYQIDPAWMARVDFAVQQAQRVGLLIVVNIHHYEEANATPQEEQDRFLGIWKQISERYQNEPDSVYFEIMNEAHGAFTTDPSLWNDLVAKTVSLIRQTNPMRPIVVGPVSYNALWNLPSLKLPEDNFLITTVHYYDPFPFTHQGAEWVSPVLPLGVSWSGENASMGVGWQNWSWSTDISFDTTAAGPVMNFTHQKSGAGVKLHSGSGFDLDKEGVTQFVFATNIPARAQVDCTDPKGSTTSLYFDSDGGSKEIVGDLDCGEGALINDIVLKSSGTEKVTVSALRLQGPTSKVSLISTERGAIAGAFKYASDWGKAHNVPIYLGEFGAFDKADMASRVRWTTAIREEAERNGFSWAYWEFGMGFGVYDREKGEYRKELLNALIP